MASVDTPEDSRKFAEMHGVDFPILSDPVKTTAAAYGVLGPMGLARRWTFYIGPDGTVLEIDKAVSPGTAGTDLFRRLTELKVAAKDR
jgi:peroxiredoxin Q/BCP